MRGNHSLTFTLPEGYGVNRALFVTVSGVPSPIATFSYGAPSISNVAPDRQGVPTGYLRVIVEGANFCAAGAGPARCGVLLVNNTDVPPLNYTHDRIVAVVRDPTADGRAGDTLVAAVEVDGRRSNDVMFSQTVAAYALVGQASWTGKATEGGQPFFIAGVASIGLVPVDQLAVRIGGRACSQLARSAAPDGDTSAAYGIERDSPLADQYRTYRLTCLTPPGAGANLPIVVVSPAGTSQADPGFRFNYAPPAIYRIVDAVNASRVYYDAALTGKGVSGVPTTGTLVIAEGANLGPADAESTLQVVGASVAALPQLTAHTHTQLAFALPPGQGAGIEVTFAAGGQGNRVGGRPAVTVAYELPAVTWVGPQGGATTGGSVVTVRGSGFGAASPTGSAAQRAALPQVSIGGAPCVLAEGYAPALDHGVLTGVLGEGEGVAPVRVSVAGQVSATTVTYAYAPPQVFSISPDHGPTSGRAPEGSPIMVTVTGASLGRRGALQLRPVFEDEAVTLGTTEVPFAAMTVYNHTHMVFPMPQGAGRLLRVVAVVAGAESAGTSVTFAYDPPSTRGWRRASCERR
jgi:hypothetical protein